MFCYLICKILSMLIPTKAIFFIVINDRVVVFKDLGSSDQNKTYRSRKVMQLCIDNFFILNNLSNENYV